jgi:peptide/nickel transport system substrate-binding protein
MDIFEPDTLDPALDYETSGLQIIQNLYDTLIFFQREEPAVFIPQLALEVPTLENGGISQDGLTYTFKIRTGVRFHDGTPFTAEDVVYTFQRNILQGGSASPMWLLTEPIFGVGMYDVAEMVDPSLIDNPEGLKDADPVKLQEVCQRLQQAITTDPAGETVIFHLAQPWAPFVATLANGWGSIRSRAWTIANGGWNGDCLTWQNYYGRNLAQVNETQLGSGAMGTGPYRLESWTKGEQIVLKANENYWRAEPAWPGGPAGAPQLKTVIVRFQSDFAGRLAALQNGEADSTRISSNAEWPDLEALTGQVCNLTDQDCQPSGNPAAPLEMIRGFPVAGRSDDIFMNWSMNTQDGNDLIGSARLDGNGTPSDFFSNVHVRQAFQSCFNYQTYLTQIMQGEGLRSVTVMLPEMVGYDAAAPQYTYDPAHCQDEFRQAIFDGSSVWDTGFSLKLPYPQGDRPVQRIAEIFVHELTALNPNFKVQSVGLEPDDYNQRYRENRLPFFTKDWLEDIHDPHNWVVPYTIGNFSRELNMPPDLTRRFEEIIDRGVAEQDPDARDLVYREFNNLFYEQAPVILMYLSIERHYQQRWVRGWYNNPLFPGLYFYVLGKD